MSRADNVIGGLFVASVGGFFAIRIFHGQISQYMAPVPKPGIYSVVTASVVGTVLYALHRNKWRLPSPSFSSRDGFSFSYKKSTKRLGDIVAAKNIGTKLRQIAYILNGGKKYEPLGIKPPKKMLIQGITGMGRATIAQALAGEIDSEFIIISGEEIVQSDKKKLLVKSLIDFSIKLKRVVILIEDAELLNDSEEFQKTLQEEIKRIPENTVILVVCSATCWPDNSFFDMVIKIELPDEEMREKLLSLRTLGKPLSSVSFNEIAKSTEGLGPGDIALLVDKAGFRAFDQGRSHITRDDFEHVLSEIERELIKTPPPAEPKNEKKDKKEKEAKTETGA